jgi:hydrogenase-4 component F
MKLAFFDFFAIDLIFIIPLFGVYLFAVFGDWRGAGWLNIILTGITFLVSLWLAWDVWNNQGVLIVAHQWFYIDSFNIYLIILTTFIGLTTAIFSRSYMLREVDQGKLSTHRMRLYHSLYQGFIFALLLALMSNNLGLLWVAMEAATLATVLLVSLYRTPEAIEAAWKYFILCGVGIAQALFGTVLLYFAAGQAIPDHHNEALLWTILYEHANQLEPTVVSIAFVFILVGYGTKVGLVPLHNWLPDAHSEGPTPMSVVLSGLLLNVGLYALVRIKTLVDSSLQTELAGYLMMGFGLLSFMVAAFFLHRQRDIKRLYSYSSIEHMGLMTFAFGLGTPLATFAALLHMGVHSLSKSALFMTVGYATQTTKTQAIDKMRGLLRTQPTVGWGLLIGTLAIAGFPPFGLFVSEFLLLTTTMKLWPWLTVILLLGLVIAFAGLFRHIQDIVYSEPPAGQIAVPANMWIVAVQLLLVLIVGLAMPPLLANWFEQTTQLLTANPIWSKVP